MSKRGGKKTKSIPEAPGAFANNAFSGLSSLGAALPDAPAPSTDTPPVAPIATAKPEPAVAKPRFPGKLVVRMEKKGRRGKTVTRVSGVPAHDLPALCKEMKKGLGCGATIEDADLILLGDLVDRAAKWLEKAGAAKLVRGT